MSLGVASQPSALEPLEAPMRNLPWGQLNFLQTTDTHGWLAGHLQEPQYSADWGDYISFATRLREKADKDGVDLLLVDTGDRIEGNGLYDASDPKGRYTYDIFKEQNIDIICTGNHELYQLDAAAREYDKTVPNFNGRYLASNLDYIKPKTGEVVPMAQRYRRFTTKNQGIRVLAFGFLFNFKGNANNTIVQPVEETIKEEWFQEAIREDVDLFVVAGHVTPRGPEYKAIFKAIRSQQWDTPIQFFGGHSHIRDFAKFDDKAFALQSGRYMETIGWLSIDGITSKGQTEPQSIRLDRELSKAQTYSTIKFRRRYIDNNIFGFHYHTKLNSSTFPTEHGKNVSAKIKSARKALKLDHTYGCAPKDLWLNRAPYSSNDSLISWLEKSVIPDVVSNPTRKDIPRLALVNTGAMRFDIFKGPFTRDTTYIVSPFISKLLYIKDVPYESAKNILPLINNGGEIFATERLDSSFLPSPEQISISSDIIVPSVSTPSLPNSNANSAQIPLSPKTSPNLIPGYTTSDDAGTDGDDTLHSPISFYRVPNCIQSAISFPSSSSSSEAPKEPENIDLVFIDFIQPWVLLALKFLGQTYEAKDVLVYKEEALTVLMENWIKENWKLDCTDADADTGAGGYWHEEQWELVY